jgi:hypothetical protein
MHAYPLYTSPRLCSAHNHEIISIERRAAMSELSNRPEKPSETDFTAVKSSTPPPDWVPKILSVGLLQFLIILIAIVILALVGPTIGNVYSGFGPSL